MPTPYPRLAMLGLCALLSGAPALYSAHAANAPGDSTGNSSTNAEADSSTNGGTPQSSTGSTLSEVVVTAERLNTERSEIETLTGATTTTINADAIAAMPGGSNVQLDTVLLQAPDVAQDSFGQIHVRGDHNDLQYRLNGIILPEGISVFSQTLDPRIIESLDLITGALPAEYGLRTAGIIDLTTKGGLLQPGGTVSLYGGSHSTLEPSGWYGGSDGPFSYFVSADVLRNDLGIETPDASSEPLHDHSTQTHGFGYIEDILNDNNRLSLVLGLSNEQFQVPDKHGLEPGGVGGITGLGPCGNGVSFYTPPCQGTDMQVLEANGQYAYPSNDLNENQHELAQYAIATWQYSEERFQLESSWSARYTSLDFEPDWIGDLLYNGIAQNAFKSDVAAAWQTDAIYHLAATHDLRFGFYLQHDNSTSATTSTALPIDPITGVQTSDVPEVIIDNGMQSQEIESVYLQDEWKPLNVFTVNYGLRFDSYRAYSGGSQLSPRLNAVWTPLAGLTVHGGYSRYFTPPPFELIASGTFNKFAGTTAVPPGTNVGDTPPIAERADYYDFGLQQKLLENALTVGLDGFWRTAQNLIDEGQFGAPIILTPFNYRFGQVGGVEFSSNYTIKNFSAYLNSAVQSAKGKDVESSQFSFPEDQLEYIADHWIHLDHEERVSASGGAAYTWLGTKVDVDFIFGTGLRQDTPWLVQVPGIGAINIPNGDHTPSYLVWNLGLSHAFHDAAGPLTLRFDVVNLFDKIYLIRSGTGVGVFEPQYGAPRGFFGGVAQDF